MTARKTGIDSFRHHSMTSFRRRQVKHQMQTIAATQAREIFFPG